MARGDRTQLLALHHQGAREIALGDLELFAAAQVLDLSLIHI